jgi:hypothetical protein
MPTWRIIESMKQVSARVIDVIGAVKARIELGIQARVRYLTTGMLRGRNFKTRLLISRQSW